MFLKKDLVLENLKWPFSVLEKELKLNNLRKGEIKNGSKKR